MWTVLWILLAAWALAFIAVGALALRAPLIDDWAPLEWDWDDEVDGYIE